MRLLSDLIRLVLGLCVQLIVLFFFILIVVDIHFKQAHPSAGNPDTAEFARTANGEYLVAYVAVVQDTMIHLVDKSSVFERKEDTNKNGTRVT